MKRIGAAAIVMLASLAARAHDKARANSYDDGWQSNWVAHCTAVYTGGSGKTDGLVLQIGDSITYANPYSQWPRYGSGKTTEDTDICTWTRASTWGTGGNDTSSKNGWYLAAADTSGSYRSMTAASGIDTAEFLSGSGNGGTTMPLETSSQNAAQTIVADATYTQNIRMDTLITAFQDAQFAVLMLGTNDVTGGRSTNNFITDLTSIIDKLEAANIVVVLSTIPPYVGKLTEVQSYNTDIRSLAQSRQIPLIDLYAEILARQPTNWSTTLIHTDGIHLSSTGSSSDPYTPGGDPATHTTGDNCLVGGYLLRSWLAVQKLKEIKAAVVDNAFIASISTAPSPPEGAPPLTVDFTGSATGGTGTYTEYAWDWDNDAVFDETGQNVSHQFATEGTYIVTLKVTDSASDTAQAIVTVVVSTGGGPSGSVTLQQDVGSYFGCIDAHIIVNLADNNYGNYQEISAYGPTSSSGERRSVIKFDLAGQIPGGSTITQATLEVNDLNAYLSGTVSAHRLTADWSELGATWNNSGVAAWTGGTYAATPADTANVSGLGWISWDLTSLVSDWYEGTYTNYGVILIASGAIEHRLDSSESTTSSLRPKLTIDYGAGTTEPTLSVAFSPNQGIEGDGVISNAGTVTVSEAPAADLTVGLSSNDPSELTVPASVVILAGQTSATFDVTVVDDPDVDWNQTVTVTATAAGCTQGSAVFTVRDDDWDTDLDGIYDQWEIDNFIGGIVECLPDGDPDNDDFTNLQEYLAGTDPHNPDTDGDGTPDGRDNNPTEPPLPMTGCGGAPGALALLMLLAARRRKR